MLAKLTLFILFLSASGAALASPSSSPRVAALARYPQDVPVLSLFEFAGTRNAAAFGSATVSLDFNGDGWRDIAVGSPRFDLADGRSDVGRISLYLGGPAPDPREKYASSQGGPGEQNGYALAAADLDQDGFDDLVVGAPKADGGLVRICLGSSSPNLSADLVLSGPLLPASFGRSVACADFNADGFPDVVVGEYAIRGTDRQQTAWVYFGGSPMDEDFDVCLLGDGLASVQETDFGISVASAGDFNADGIDDILVAAPTRPVFAPVVGRAYLYFGSHSPDGNADLEWFGSLASDFFASIVGGIGDVSGDGVDDVAITSFPGGTSSSGWVQIYHGSREPDLSPDRELKGERAGDRLGAAIAPLGDVDRDGFADFALGAPGADTGGLDGGAVSVCFGSPDSISIRRIDGSFEGEHFGQSVASAADFDHDGMLDLAVGAPNAAQGVSANGRVAVLGFDHVRLASPIGGENWVAGEPARIAWRCRTPVDVRYQAGDAESWITLASGVGGSGASELLVTAPAPSAASRISVVMTGFPEAPLAADASAWPFRIVERPYVPRATALDRTLAPAARAGALRGHALAAVGDLDRDGLDELVFAENDAGGSCRLALVRGHGEITRLGLEPALSELGEPAFAGTGDVNGDGAGDWLVAVAAPSGARRAALFAGRAPLDSPPLLSWGGEIDEAFAIAFAPAGDFDGDGARDFAVVSRRGDGRAVLRVYRGGASLDSIADFTLSPPDSVTSRPLTLAGGGDLDGDGRGDLALGSPAAQPAGFVSVFFGASEPAAVRRLVCAGTAFGEGFGSSLAIPGDLDADGYDDLLAGAPFANSSAGRVSVLRGFVEMHAEPAATLAGRAPGELFGFAIAPLGDANADGYADALIGAPGADGERGSARAYFGGVSLGPAPDLAFQGRASGDRFGLALAGPIRAGGDGALEAVAAAPFADLGPAAEPDAGEIRRLRFSRYALIEPAPRARWHVGSAQRVSWRGAEPAIATLVSQSGAEIPLEVPECDAIGCFAEFGVPSTLGAFARVRLVPARPGVSGETWGDSIRIESAVALERFDLRLVPGGVELEWLTSPRAGEQGLRYYVVDRVARDGTRSRVSPDSLVRSALFVPEHERGVRYQLSIVDGLGDALELGEVVVPSLAAGFRAFPSPLSGEALSLELAVPTEPAGISPADLRLELLDIAGRRVASFPAGGIPTEIGLLRVEWNVRAGGGVRPAPGRYVLRASAPSRGFEARRPLVILR